MHIVGTSCEVTNYSWLHTGTRCVPDLGNNAKDEMVSPFGEKILGKW